MKSDLKKLTAAVLSAALIMSFTPASASAEESTNVSTGTAVAVETPVPSVTPQNTAVPATATAVPANPAKTPTPVKGWNEKHTSYYKHGKPVTGRVKIKGKHYFFSKKGIMKTGVQKVKKKMYFFKPENGVQVEKTGLYKNKYYMKKGVLQTGFIEDGSSAWFFKPDGTMQKGGKVKYLSIPKSGNLGSAYANGLRVLNRNGWTLEKAYSWSYHLRYANRWMRKKTSEEYANVGFETGTGNCFVMAATFYIQGKLLGYDIHQVHGYIGKAPHSWTIIKQQGRTWVYDPNFRNETGRNGWKVYYGKPGTWRYSGFYRMN